jgi:hypothetical protein
LVFDEDLFYSYDWQKYSEDYRGCMSYRCKFDWEWGFGSLGSGGYIWKHDSSETPSWFSNSSNLTLFKNAVAKLTGIYDQSGGVGTGKLWNTDYDEYYDH